MKRLLIPLFSIALWWSAAAQDKAPSDGGWWNENPSLVLPIRAVGVTGVKPMKEIGVQKTQLDTLVLHENIALSMADVLTFNSSIFIKQYGRATLSTVAFRGTGPSHTQVVWNGMRINSPMLGMTDFSMIPSYFVDDAQLLHGTSSVNVTGGGLGGAVMLATKPADTQGFGLQYTQGIGSFWTTDEFLRLTYGNDRWQTSTRVVYSSSPNEYSYRNHDKKENIYDDEHNIIGSYYPREKHDDGAFRDFHLLQEAYYNTGNGDRFGLNAWLIASKRGLGRMTTDYGDPKKFINEQRERTLRSVLSWDHLRRNWKVAAKAGYIYSWFAYDYANDVGNGKLEYMTTSRNWYHTLFVSGEGEYYIGRKWLFTAQADLHQHFVTNNDRRIISQDMNRKTIGYNHARTELSTSITAKWMPTERLGLSVTLREEMYGAQWTPLIPAFYADYLISKRGTIRAKASVSRNYRYPTLNDLYFLPGGNPDLKNEQGFTYDAGVSFEVGKPGIYKLSGGANWFDSYIDDWIIWLPTTKGFFSPRNVKKVHAYGIEVKANLAVQPAKDWLIDLNGSYSWTPSINEGEKMSPADQSVGKQLPYVPEHSASLTGRLSWRSWAFLYKWAFYSERFTMSSNDYTLTGHLPEYFMSNVSLEKNLFFKPVDVQLKFAVNNLFNEDYLSVLSRPMPGINFELFIGITPKFGKNKKKSVNTNL